MELHTTNLTLLYLGGHLRRMMYKDEEILRMIYSALRDDRWFTLPMTIENEHIVQHKNSFHIQYVARYRLSTIDYEALITIDGNENDIITFHFQGKAYSDFLRNRIGICTHHPIKECIGQLMLITHPDGSTSTTSFPRSIAPYPTFKDIKKLSWRTAHQVEATLEFEGDVFESEDQRNWSDASFKTYSTPVEIPFPVQIKIGDKVEQRVIFSIQSLNKPGSVQNSQDHETKYLFPRIGYARSNEPLNSSQIDLLKQIMFNHYRVEIDFTEGWAGRFDHACEEARSLNTSLELIVFFSDIAKEYTLLKIKLSNIVSSILILEKGKSIASAALVEQVLSVMKVDFPGINIGAGTFSHFVDINRNREINLNQDFISYTITPQAHLSDDLVMIENLAAIQYPIQTIRSISPKPIHLSAVTLKSRDYPSLSVDHRQHTKFASDWTTIFLKYISGIDQITLFETTGTKGIINLEGPSPVYILLKRISDFKPKYIIKIEESNPLKQDSLILENEKGERLELPVTF